MSLAINVDRVEAVLLADGWHEVSLNEQNVSSFTLGAYDFIRRVEGKDPCLAAYQWGACLVLGLVG
jgi:hypothetical protein